jgi:hypothetical protein
MTNSDSILIPISNTPSTGNISQPKSLNIQVDNSFLSSLQCIICKEIPRDPCTLDCCEIICCLSCVEQVENIKTFTCPKCDKTGVTKSSMNKFLMRIFENLKLTCRHPKCGLKITFGEIKEHEKFCEFNPDGLHKCPECKLNFIKSSQNHQCVSELLKAIEETKKEITSFKSNISEKNNELLYKIRHSLK